MSIDLSPEALSQLAPGLTLATLARLAVPPLHPDHLSRVASGRPATAATRHRISLALERARELAAKGELPQPKRQGRPRR